MRGSDVLRALCYSISLVMCFGDKAAGIEGLQYNTANHWQASITISEKLFFYVCLSIVLFLSFCLSSFFIILFVTMSVCCSFLSFCYCLTVCRSFLSFCLSVWTDRPASVCLSVYVSICLTVQTDRHMGIFLSAHQSICLSVCLFIYLSITVLSPFKVTLIHLFEFSNFSITDINSSHLDHMLTVQQDKSH